jgi:hypothetical protein
MSRAGKRGTRLLPEAEGGRGEGTTGVTASEGGPTVAEAAILATVAPESSVTVADPVEHEGMRGGKEKGGRKRCLRLRWKWGRGTCWGG